MSTRNEQLLAGVQQKREEISTKSREILEKQAEENRAPTDEETKTLAQFVKDMRTLDDQEADYKEAVRVEQEVLGLGQKIGADEAEKRQSKGFEFEQINSVREPIPVTWGEEFVNSPGFKSLKEDGKMTGTWTTGPVNIQAKAGTLFAGSYAPGSGQGGGLLTTPQVVPGVVNTLFQPLTVADLLAQGQTNTNTLRYVVEGTATSGAAGVAEGGTKPPSDLALSTVDEPIKKIATILTVSDEMLEDAAQVQSYIDNRLSLFVRIEEERQICYGSGTNELVGITGRGINTYARGTVDNNAVAIFKAVNGTRGSSLLEPDAIVMHPDNWQTTRLLQDGNQQFYGGGPFQGPYGNGQIDPASGQLSGAMDTLWNKPVIVTTAVGSGTALLGSFKAAAQLFRRSGVTVEASNSHNSYFVSNLVAIRAESRLGLCVYRPSAFTAVTGLA